MRSMLAALLLPFTAHAALSTGTVVHTTMYTIDTDLPVSESVTLTANADGLAVGVANNGWLENIQVIFDPGGGDEVTKVYMEEECSLASAGGEWVSWFYFDHTELPSSGTYTLEINFDADTDDPSAFAFIAIPIESGGVGTQVVQCDTSAATTSATVTTDFAGSIASGSLVAQVVTHNLDGVSFTFDDLSTEEFDVAGSGGGGNAYAAAWEIGPTETQNYVVTQSGSTGRLTVAGIEIAEASASPSTCWISEYSSLVEDDSGRVVHLGASPAIATQAITYSTSTESSAFNDSTRFIGIRCNAKAHYVISTDGTDATAASPYVPADKPEYFGIHDDGNDYVIDLYDGSS